MTYRLEFTIAGLPRMTNPSGRKNHWRVVKKERDQWIAAVMAIVKTRTRPVAPLERAKLTLTRYSSVSPDPDGLVSGFKAIVDALVKAGVIANDRTENIGFPDYRWEKAPRGKGSVRVRVEGLE